MCWTKNEQVEVIAPVDENKISIQNVHNISIKILELHEKHIQLSTKMLNIL